MGLDHGHKRLLAAPVCLLELSRRDVAAGAMQPARFHHATRRAAASSTWASVRHGPPRAMISALNRPITDSAKALS